MNIAKISDIPVDAKAGLNQSTKERLIKIVEQEFNEQATQFDHEIRAEKVKLIDAERARLGIQKKVRELAKVVSRCNFLEEELRNLGFDAKGELCTYKQAGIDLLARVETALASKKPASNLKNKIIARLSLASTQGEAMVILREVLGNGIIPSLTVKQLEEPKA